MLGRLPGCNRSSLRCLRHRRAHRLDSQHPRESPSGNRPPATKGRLTMRTCPNCRSYFHCNCTWDEQLAAMEIIRRREAEARRKAGQPTVIEEEQEQAEVAVRKLASTPPAEQAVQ